MSLRKALSRIQDPELASEVQSLLARLQMLPEGATANLGGSKRKGKIEGMEPRGAWRDLQDVSLYAYYGWHFARAAMAGNEIEIRRLLIEGRMAYDEFTKGVDEDRLMIERRSDELKDSQFVLQHCQNVHAAIVATRYGWPLEWVKLVRTRNRQDPMLGHGQPSWREEDEETRYGYVQDCRSEGLSQRATAQRLGISVGSVGKYWSRDKAA